MENGIIDILNGAVGLGLIPAAEDFTFKKNHAGWFSAPWGLVTRWNTCNLRETCLSARPTAPAVKERGRVEDGYPLAGSGRVVACVARDEDISTGGQSHL